LCCQFFVLILIDKDYLQDRISQLPDEILTYILSLLPIEEATRTSVLSCRWKKLWTYVPSLIIKDFISSPDMQLRPVKSSKFLLHVYKVSEKYNPSEELNIYTDFDGTNSRDVDGWIKFAMENWARMLDLNSEHYYNNIFPEKKFPLLEQLPLTSLYLCDISITGEILEHYISNCPFLELLSVNNLESLVNLRLVDHRHNLKYFQVTHCYNLKNLEISGRNLVNFWYIGPNIVNMTLKNVPLLSSATIGGKYCESIMVDSNQHASYLSQLQTLRLWFTEGVSTIFAFSACPIIFLISLFWIECVFICS
jgi:hypothetical protein